MMAMYVAVPMRFIYASKLRRCSFTFLPRSRRFERITDELLLASPSTTLVAMKKEKRLQTPEQQRSL
jgi:hypothetical protein